MRHFLLLMLLFLGACGGKGVKVVAPTFAIAEKPAMITEPAQVQQWVAAHFWDNYRFADTSYFSYPDVTEQAMTDFTNILLQLSPNNVTTAVNTMLERASVDSAVLRQFIALSERYLHDPNSPYRNEEAYIVALEWQIGSHLVAEQLKELPRTHLTMASNNRLGTKAIDFTYTLADGRQSTLYDIKAKYTVIFLNNPDCPACKEYREAMCSDQMFTGLINKGEIKVLALYTDEDLTAWERYRPNIPTTWINGYDNGRVLFKTRQYDLKAIPSLYVLSADKTVLLKDATVGAMLSYLENQE